MQREKDYAKISSMPIPAAKSWRTNGYNGHLGHKHHKSKPDQIYLSFSPQKNPRLALSNHIRLAVKLAGVVFTWLVLF